MLADEITRRLKLLQQTAFEFSQAVRVIDGNYENKENQIKSLELRIEKLKEEIDLSQQKANHILQEATEQTAVQRKESSKLLDDAKAAKISAEYETVKARKMMDEAQSLFSAAVERQKTADTQWHIIEAREKRLKEAMHV